ncbi:ROK family protein [Kitasatospora indigofera]|uniref:ROK family transcriptional regulator n=1 Tax=Kitasatospora indigofera TaxID=67307 RepID=UPI003680A49E
MQFNQLTGGEPALLRRLNVQAVLRVLRGAEPATLTQISHAATLSRQTVDAVITELTREGWIEETPPEAGLGRPARRYRFRAEVGHVLGIDVGVDRALMLLSDLDGTVLARRDSSLRAGDREERLQDLHEAASAFVDDAGVPRRRMYAVALGMPAIIDDSGRVRLSTPIPEWNDLDLAAEASAWFDCPAFVENDANLATVAEHWIGAAQGSDDVICILSGNRSGAGMILAGRLHRGQGGAAGEIGALAILGWLGEEMAELREDVDVAAVIAAAGTGQPEALDRVDRFARTLAQGAAAMILTVNPGLVVVAGGFSRAGDTLADPLRHHLDELCLYPPEVAMSPLGVDGVALGAVRFALERVDAELFGLHRGGAVSDRRRPEPQLNAAAYKDPRPAP